MKKTILLIAVLTSLIPNIQAQSRAGAVGFYNLENLFDTVDDPEIDDEEYLPNGKKQWTQERYQSKLDNMSRVLADLNLDLVGLCEIENRKVLEDLISTPNLKSKGYEIIHFNSKDRRGIDVAALYKPDIFKPISQTIHSVKNPDDPDFKTRDILLVSGKIGRNDTLHFIVNHWPSRWGTGGEPKRILAAGVARGIVDSLQSLNANAKIIITGDFNDDPRNKSLKQTLNANTKIKEPGQLLNTSYPKYKEGIGTLYYKGAFNLFDQIIVSEGLTKNGLHYKDGSFTIASFQYIVHTKGELRGTPFRTFSRGQFLNGYSDHFPVYIVLEY
ncbi:endonuclease/exonuclease/phosphatase family protein [Reichenbachiella versicolor]|uniref:endonuclease/exonuclease/phosphatase family protein n=1 Tax=Reichenbachiella versicolor TaxID=1821036 RepID=UPI000D6E463E|nr:endonuclease [Reichenbachiella versicolor]